MRDIRVEFHPDTASEAGADVRWYAAQSERAAERFVQELRRAREAITASPERWPITESEIRRIPLRRFPYSIFYRAVPGLVQIVAVAHGRRRPGYWRGRLTPMPYTDL